MLSPKEDIDRLVRWLGPESSKLARRISPAHVHHPTAGLQMTWERLDEKLGAPEAVEQALFKKTDEFP